MSHCIECGEWMPPIEAQQWLECRDCRELGGKGSRVRTIYDDPKPQPAEDSEFDVEDLLDIEDRD